MKNALIFCTLIGACTSGSDQNLRNSDIFSEAGQASFPAFTTTALSFDGGIQALVTAINGQANNRENAYSATIEGIVTMPSNYGVGVGGLTTAESTPQVDGCRKACSDPAFSTSGTCTTATQVWALEKIYARSFVLQDANAGILVAYGLEPPIADITQSGSMKYILKSRQDNMAVFGDRMRITVTMVQKYGTGSNVQPIVTDFSSPTIVSSRNSIGYTKLTTAMTRVNDLHKVRQLEGYITLKPSFVQCGSGSDREFQFNFQKGYIGTLCSGATSFADAQAGCTGSKTAYNIQLGYNLGAGTLSGFDVDNSFSYNISEGSKVRITGAVFPPRFNQGDSNLALMIGQKVQVETLR